MILDIDGVGKVDAQNTVQHVIYTNLLDICTKGQIDNFDEDLEKRLDDTDFLDDVRADFYIDDMDEANETAHRDGANNLSNDAYGAIMAEERPDQDDIDDAARDKYIGAEMIMDMKV